MDPLLKEVDGWSLDKYVLNELNQRDVLDRRVSCVGLAARLRSNEEAIARSLARLLDKGLVSKNLVIDDAPVWFRKRRRPKLKQMSLFEEGK